MKTISPILPLKLIVTALRQEARPLIDILGLTQDSASKKIPVYTSGDTLLAISGIGKVRAGVATAHLIHLAGMPESGFLVNVGMCGAKGDEIALGEALVVNKIRDYSSGREFFPEMLRSHGLREVSLGTFDRPVTKDIRPILDCEVVDMEASGVFQAGRFFLDLHQMVFLKVASDYLEIPTEDFPRMIKHYERSVGDWLPVLENKDLLISKTSIIKPDHDELLEFVSKTMRLTKTQSLQLRDAAMRYLMRGGGDLNNLKTNVQSRPVHKASRNSIFNAMIATLDASTDNPNCL